MTCAVRIPYVDGTSQSHRARPGFSVRMSFIRDYHSELRIYYVAFLFFPRTWCCSDVRGCFVLSFLCSFQWLSYTFQKPVDYGLMKNVSKQYFAVRYLGALVSYTTMGTKFVLPVQRLSERFIVVILTGKYGMVVISFWPRTERFNSSGVGDITERSTGCAFRPLETYSVHSDAHYLWWSWWISIRMCLSKGATCGRIR